MKYLVDFQDKVISVRDYKYYQFLNENNRMVTFCYKWYKPSSINAIRLNNNSPNGRFISKRRNISSNPQKSVRSEKKKFMNIKRSSIFEVNNERVKKELGVSNRRPNYFMTHNDYHLQRNIT